MDASANGNMDMKMMKSGRGVSCGRLCVQDSFLRVFRGFRDLGQGRGDGEGYGYAGAATKLQRIHDSVCQICQVNNPFTALGAVGSASVRHDSSFVRFFSFYERSV